MEATINMDTQTVALTKVDNGLEATPRVGLTPNESYVNQGKVDCNSLVSDAAAELNISKSEVKNLVQKEKVQSELKDGHYYVNVGEVHNYLIKAEELEALDKEVKSSIDKVIPTKALAPMGHYVVTKTEEEKAEFLKKYNLEINDIDGKLKRISSEKPVNSPFNYTGNKEELYPQILPYFKRNIAKFYDVFGGGGIVGLNVQAQSVVYNDIDKNLSDVVENLSKNTVAENYEVVLAVIEKYNLSIDNKEAYIQLRDIYNDKDNHWSLFYVLMIFSYQNNISYSKRDKEQKKFNKGFGYRDFNKSLKNKFLLFTDKLIANAHRMDFQSVSYEFINIENFQENDFVYLDPAYLLTAYKYGIEWEEKEEIAFLKSLDSLHERKVNFALSNVIHHNGRTNHILIDWAEKNDDYNVIYLNKSYADQCSLETEGRTSTEVLITNYKTLNSQEVHEVTMMDTEIIQGRFVDNSNTIENIKKHFTDAEEHAKAYIASMNNALREKCAELIGRIKTGQELIIFYDECKRDGKGFKVEVEEQFPFSYETARGYVNLAKNERITALKIDDIMNFKRKSLDALKDIAALTDVEYELFRNGEFKLPKTRKIASNRQKPSEVKNDEVLEENVSNAPDTVEMVPMAEDGANNVADKTEHTETEFINPFSDLATDAEAKELLDMDKEKLVELFLQYKQLTSETRLPSSSNNNFPDYLDVTEVQNSFLIKAS